MAFPEGFRPSGSFAGLENPHDRSTITVAELPMEGYKQIYALFSDLDAARDSFRSKGISIDEAEVYEIDGSPVPVLIGRQPIPGGEVGKYLALFRGESAVLVTFNVFDAEVMSRSVVEAAIRSVTLGRLPGLQEKASALPFSFEVAEPFLLGDVMGGSAALLPTFVGTDPTGLKPVVIVARSLRTFPDSTNLESIAEQLLHDTQGFEKAEIVVNRETQFAGGNAVYVEAIAGKRKVVQYLALPADGAYLRLVAYGAATELDRLMPVVSEIAGTVRPR